MAMLNSPAMADRFTESNIIENNIENPAIAAVFHKIFERMSPISNTGDIITINEL